MKLFVWSAPWLAAIGIWCLLSQPSLAAEDKSDASKGASSEVAKGDSSGVATLQPRREAERKISPTDTLYITIVGETGLQTDFKVSASGTIQFPFLEVVEVAGLTPSELSLKLRELLMKDYFVDPQVLVTVKDYRADFVTVIGQV
ncbi:MAG TPA: polysaccharide biosynthesis/export family protein, partial [Verrucomicrobiota bacterium]|nr:polysaccharide biosynthesis/export family protein [Verrucomicrobiota bacterium]